MKRLILMLAIATLLSSCRKNKEISILYDVIGLKNGVDWKASSRNLMTKPDTNQISASTFDLNGAEIESLYFSNIRYSRGKQSLFNNRTNKHSWTAYYTTIGGDVLDGVYIPCEGQNNFIEILQLDQFRKYIKGIFQVTYIQDTISNQHKPHLPDTIRITNEAFSSYYK